MALSLPASIMGASGPSKTSAASGAAWLPYSAKVDMSTVSGASSFDLLPMASSLISLVSEITVVTFGNLGFCVSFSFTIGATWW